jgi:hypothetical protein
MPSSVTGFLTGGLIDPKTPDYAALAAKNEAQREAIINLGLQQINAVFGGGSAPFYDVASGGFNPSSQYFTLGSKGFQPYGKPGSVPPWGGSGGPLNVNNLTKGALLGGPAAVIDPVGSTIGAGFLSKLFGGGTKHTALQHLTDLENANQVFTGTNQTFPGFTPGFFQQRAQDYINYALPQLQEQHAATRAGVEYGLANRGLYGASSARNKLVSEVEREYGQGAQTIADTGQTQAQQLKTNIEQARQTAIDQLYQTADPARATAGAISAAAGFSIPQTFTPLANMFSNLLTNYYTNQLLSGTQTPQYILPGSQYSANPSALGPTAIQ